MGSFVDSAVVEGTSDVETVDDGLVLLAIDSCVVS